MKLRRALPPAATAAILFGALGAGAASAAPSCRFFPAVPAVRTFHPAVTIPGTYVPGDYVPGTFVGDTYVPGYSLPGYTTPDTVLEPAHYTIDSPAVPAHRTCIISGLSDKGWSVVPGSLLVHKEEYTGDFAGTVRLVNRNRTAQSASVTFTAFRGRRQVATLTGSVNRVARGRPVTVTLFTTDNYVPGMGRFTFQVDYSF